MLNRSHHTLVFCHDVPVVLDCRPHLSFSREQWCCCIWTHGRVCRFQRPKVTGARPDNDVLRHGLSLPLNKLWYPVRNLINAFLNSYRLQLLHQRVAVYISRSKVLIINRLIMLYVWW